MHTVKWIVGVLVAPMSIVLLLLIAGLLLRAARRTRAGTVLLVSAAVFGYLSCTGLLAKALMAPLERNYAPPDGVAVRDVKFVVVLGSAYQPRPGIPVTAALDHDGLARIVEGVRLLRQLPNARLVLPGGVPGTLGPGVGYARLARDLGVEEQSLVVIEQPTRDTASEARQVAAYLQGAPFFLVTSADSLPRAMRLMERAGARPIPAPALYRTGPLAWGDLLPRAASLRATEVALHEWVGLAALAMGLE